MARNSGGNKRVGVTFQATDKVSGATKAAAKALASAADDVAKADQKVAKEATKHTRARRTNVEESRKATPIYKTMATALTATAAAATAAAAGIFAFTKRQAEALDKVFVSTDRLGVSAEFFTRMGFAAKQSGGSVELLDKSLTALSRRAAGATQLFDKWGVSVRDSNGNMKSTERLFRDVTSRMKGAQSQAERLAIAQDLMSESGRLLVPMLQQGNEGLDQMAAKADQLGITVSTTSSIIGNEFMNQLGAAQDALSGMAREAGQVFMPVLTEVFVATQEAAGQLSADIRGNQEALQDMARTGIVSAVKGFALLARSIQLLSPMLDAIVIGFKSIGFAVNSAFLQVAEIAAKFSDKFTGIRDHLRGTVQIAFDGLNESIQEFGDTAEVIGEVADRADAFARTLENVQRTHRTTTEAARRHGEVTRGASISSTQAAKDQAAAEKEVIKALEAKRKAERDADVLALQIQRDGVEQRNALRLKEWDDAKKLRDDAAKDQLDQAKANAESAAEFTAGTLLDGFRAATKGAKAFGNFVKRMLAELAAKIVATGLIRMFTNMFTGGASGAAGGIFGALLGFSKGGVVPELPSFSTGGLIGNRLAPGPAGGRDDRVIAAKTGEMVLPVDMTRQLASLFGRRPQAPTAGFSQGGMVGAGPSPSHAPTQLVFQTVGLPTGASAERWVRDELAPVWKRLAARGAV